MKLKVNRPSFHVHICSSNPETFIVHCQLLGKYVIWIYIALPNVRHFMLSANLEF